MACCSSVDKGAAAPRGGNEVQSMADRSGFDRLPTPGCDERVVHARVQVLLFFRVDVETTGRTGWRLVNSTTTTASATPGLASSKDSVQPCELSRFNIMPNGISGYPKLVRGLSEP